MDTLPITATLNNVHVPKNWKTTRWDQLLDDNNAERKTDDDNETEDAVKPNPVSKDDLVTKIGEQISTMATSTNKSILDLANMQSKSIKDLSVALSAAKQRINTNHLVTDPLWGPVDKVHLSSKAEN